MDHILQSNKESFLDYLLFYIFQITVVDKDRAQKTQLILFFCQSRFDGSLCDTNIPHRRVIASANPRLE